MLKRLIPFLVTLAISACSPAVSTVVVAPTEAFTPSPTLAPTQTPTLTPTLTPTETPLPTPLGGGTGTIYFDGNHYADQLTAEQDGVYAVSSDSTDLKQILSRSQIESMIGGKFKYIDYWANSDQNYISADALYSLTTDWKIGNKIDLPKFSALFTFFPDYQHVMYYQTDGNLYVANLADLETKKLLSGNEYVNGISPDGSTIYFVSGLDVYQKAINIDGSDKRNILLNSVKAYVPYEGINTPLTKVRSVYTPQFDSYAVSPDKEQVVFTWGDLLFITSASDTEFADIKLLTRLPGSDTQAEIHADVTRWSPDQTGLVILLTRSNLSRSHYGSEIIYVSIVDGKSESIASSEKSNYYLCGFSPDGNQIGINYYDDTTKKDSIQLVQVGKWSPVTLVELDRWIGCPIWESVAK